MNFNVLLSRIFCSGVFSYFLGLGVGLVLLYSLDKMQEKKKMDETLQEIEAMLKALELRKLKAETEH